MLTSPPMSVTICVYIYYIIIHAKLRLRSSPKSSSSVISIERCLHRSTNLWGNGPSANAGHRRMQDIRTEWSHCVEVLKMREPVKKSIGHGSYNQIVARSIQIIYYMFTSNWPEPRWLINIYIKYMIHSQLVNASLFSPRSISPQGWPPTAIPTALCNPSTTETPRSLASANGIGSIKSRLYHTILYIYIHVSNMICVNICECDIYIYIDICNVC